MIDTRQGWVTAKGDRRHNIDELTTYSVKYIGQPPVTFFENLLDSLCHEHLLMAPFFYPVPDIFGATRRYAQTLFSMAMIVLTTVTLFGDYDYLSDSPSYGRFFLAFGGSLLLTVFGTLVIRLLFLLPHPTWKKILKHRYCKMC